MRGCRARRRTGRARRRRTGRRQARRLTRRQRNGGDCAWEGEKYGVTIVVVTITDTTTIVSSTVGVKVVVSSAPTSLHDPPHQVHQGGAHSRGARFSQPVPHFLPAP